MHYFSERELGARPRTVEEIPLNVWRGIVAEVRSRIGDGSFGASFPEQCPDGLGPYTTNDRLMREAVAAQFPRLEWPLNSDNLPEKYDVLDFIEFCLANVAQPSPTSWHQFFQHSHLVFDRPTGQRSFQHTINQIFSRNELAYDLPDNGQIIRLAPPVLREALAAAVFYTGDAELDHLLETARIRFVSPDPQVRKDALEKIWDAWERLKTIENPNDKKTSITMLLSRTAPEPNFRQTVEAEARALTEIGNAYRIRHSEVGKIPINTPDQIDYLFHRMFAAIRLLLRATGRGG